MMETLRLKLSAPYFYPTKLPQMIGLSAESSYRLERVGVNLLGMLN